MIDTVEKIGKIQVIRWQRPNRWTDGRLNLQYVPKGAWKSAVELSYTKYNIKETDFRVKTATFTSPNYIDLTEGLTAVRIYSKYHENFAGIILDVEYEPETGLYNYQCQDFSRIHMFNSETKVPPKTWSIYTLLTSLITKNNISNLYKNGIPHSYTKADRDFFADELSGVKPLWKYDQSLYKGNRFKGNPFKTKPALVMRNKTVIELVRDIVYNCLGFFDVWINERGIIQIDPISKTDWESTGLHLTTGNALKEKYKFSTTNAITHVAVTGSGRSIGEVFSAKDSDLLNFDLAAFFGGVYTSISDPTQKNKTSAASSTSNSTKNNSTTTNVGKDGNPFNNKKKNIIVSADSGSGDFRGGIISKLKRDGWNVRDLGTGPGTHSTSYNILSKNYAVNLTIYNGADPKTIDEPVTGWLKGKHEKYGVRLVQMFDTRHWTSTTGRYNAHGMKPFRYGNFDGYRVPKAWDDNYSGARSGVLINDLGAWYKKYYSKVVHCAAPSVDECYQQFKAGGYLKMKGEK